MLPTVLVPAYRPGRALVDTLTDLRAARPDWHLLVVDDGSGTSYAHVFSSAAAVGAEVLTSKVNRGKGAALKTGFTHVATSRPGSSVVCADADGQHAVDDIVAVGERLSADPAARRIVLGTRTFDGAVPLRSRVGNTITRWLFTAATRSRVADTQTGLRGIPAGLLAWARTVPGDRYEYELQVLLRAGRAGIRLDPEPVATIYLDHNSSSHFRPVADSLRVYAPLLVFLASSLAAFAIDTVALLALEAVTDDLPLSVVGARLTSAGVNFAVNRHLVFAGGGRVRPRRALGRYAVLAGSLLALNYLLLSSLSAAGLALLPAKLLTELALVSGSFAAQRAYVFAPPPQVPRDVTADAQSQPMAPTGPASTIDTSSR